MTKEEAKNRLRKAGYTVSGDNSVVTVIIPPDKAVKGVVKEVRDILKSGGYEASFAVKQLKDASDHAGDEAYEPDYDTDVNLDVNADVNTDAKTYDEEASDSDDQAYVEPVSEPDDESVVKDAGGEMPLKDGEESSDDDYFDEDDSDMILTEDAVQFSLDDFGLDY